MRQDQGRATRKGLGVTETGPPFRASRLGKERNSLFRYGGSDQIVVSENLGGRFTNRRNGVTLFGWIALIILLIGDAISGEVSTSTSVSALITTVLVVVALVVLYPIWLFDRRPAVNRHLFPLLLFLVWAILVTAAFQHFDKESVQNLAVYVLFFSTIAIVGSPPRMGPGHDSARLLVLVGWLRVVVYGVVLYVEGVNNSAGLYSRRDFAIEALLIMCVVMMSQDARRRTRWLPYALAAEIALSESRTATAIAALLLIAVAVRGRSGTRAVISVLARIAVVVLIGLWAVEAIPSIHDRIFGDGETQVLGVELNTSGRDVIWDGLVANAEVHNVWIGQGSGSATDFVRNDEGPVGVEAAEPHNDYLRIWYDFGYVGILIWVIASLTLLRAMWRRGRRTGNRMCYAGVLSLLSVLGLMVTGNVIVYYFAMLPLGVIIGFALGEVPGQPESDVLPES